MNKLGKNLILDAVIVLANTAILISIILFVLLSKTANEFIHCRSEKYPDEYSAKFYSGEVVYKYNNDQSGEASNVLDGNFDEETTEPIMKQRYNYIGKEVELVARDIYPNVILSISVSGNEHIFKSNYSAYGSIEGIVLDSNRPVVKVRKFDWNLTYGKVTVTEINVENGSEVTYLESCLGYGI